MSKPSVKPIRRRTPATPAPHPVLDHSAKLRERAQALGLGCKDKVWRGWQVKHRFVCHRGHDLTLLPAYVLHGFNSCSVCREEEGQQHLQALAVAADVTCLDSDWRGVNGVYRWRCKHGHEWKQRGRGLQLTLRCLECERIAKCKASPYAAMLKASQAAGVTCLDAVSSGATHTYRFRCQAGHEWRRRGHLQLKQPQCVPCARAALGNPLRKTDNLDKIHELARARGGVCLSTHYTKLADKYEFRCAAGHEWRSQGSTIISGSWCRRCFADEQRLFRRSVDGLERLQASAQARGGQCLSSEYLGQTARYRWRCANGHEWELTGAHVLAGVWCRMCFHDTMRLSIDHAHEAARARGGRCLSDQYVNSNSKLRWLCDRGHEWKAALSTIRRGHWCQQCAGMARISNRNSKARGRYDDAGARLMPDTLKLPREQGGG